MRYADVVIDNNTDATDLRYTYAYDGAEDTLLSAGRKVKVPFGMHDRETDGYVTAVHDELPEGLPKGRIKKIRELDENVCLSEEAVRTALWMRNRYLCRYIEALKC